MENVIHLPVYSEVEERPDRANLDRVTERIAAARARGEPVLVFCGHGVRRSPLAVAWFLHRTQGLTLDEAYARITAARPQVDHVRKWAGHWETLYVRDPPVG